jgi:hypothetical protein
MNEHRRSLRCMSAALAVRLGPSSYSLNILASVVSHDRARSREGLPKRGAAFDPICD